jgi:EpsI family protein
MSRGVAIGGGVLLAAATLLVFREPLLAMVHRWDVSPMYSYGYFVPVVSAYLLWVRSAEFERAGMAPARLAGGAVLLASLAALAVGKVNAIQVLEQLAFISAVAGIILFLFGRRYLWLSAPAVGYLLFMVPMWDVFTEPLHPPFQENSARLGVAMMRAIDVPVFREGTIISLPNLTIEVARECSGVNYLVAVLALALPMAFLRLRGGWRRITLIVSALIVAALANGLRVALIGSLAYWEVGSPLHGPFHVLHGLFVAAVGFVVIFVGLRLLEDDAAPLGSSRQPVKQEPVSRGTWRPGDAYGLATVFLTLAFVGVAPQAREVGLARPLESLPHNLGQWTTNPSGLGSADRAPSPIAAWSSADRRLARVYRSPSGGTVSVEVYYYAAQVQGRELVSDASADLHRGTVPIVIEAGDDRFSANSGEWREQGETALFWYDTDGDIESRQIGAKIATMWRAILSGRTNGAAVVLRTVTSATASEELQDLAKALQPALRGLWSSDTH